ncbi:MAG: hypothetical protein QW728_07725 [Thermoplasmata archaeon]
MKNFAKSNEGKELAALCLDFGYKLAETAGELTRPQINFLMISMRIRNERAYFQQLAQAQSADGSTVILFEDDSDTTNV